VGIGVVWAIIETYTFTLVNPSVFKVIFYGSIKSCIVYMVPPPDKQGLVAISVAIRIVTKFVATGCLLCMKGGTAKNQKKGEIELFHNGKKLFEVKDSHAKVT